MLIEVRTERVVLRILHFDYLYNSIFAGDERAESRNRN